MFGAERLHQHPPALVAPARPPGHLRHEVKGPFRRAEVGQVQGRVGLDHAHQRHVGKIEPLGDHLRAQQDACLARTEFRQGLFVGPAGPHRVGVHADQGGVGEACPHFRLQFLRTHAPVADFA